jgi:hypothetical protein
MNYLDNNTRQLHLWYPLTALKEEISVRTAYLGKLRRTEETPHLLDLIHLTEDEERLMLSCYNNAMADLYEPLSKYARELNVPTMVMNDGDGNSIDVPANLEVKKEEFDDSGVRTDNLGTIGGALGVRIKSGNTFDKTRYSVSLFVEITYTTGYKIKDMPGDNYIPDETKTELVRVNTTSIGGDTFEGTFELNVPLKGETESLTASRIIYFETKFHSVTLYAINAKDVPQFGWVKYGSKLYQTIETTNENDFLDTIVYGIKPNDKYILYPPIDPRYSIRYLLVYPKSLNTQYIEPLDIALHEALVCHIIKNWLEYSYPSEVEVWDKKYLKALKNVYSRSNMPATPIIKLTPRWF